MQEITNVPEMILHRLTTYELGDRFCCKADNLDPEACLTGVDGATREKTRWERHLSVISRATEGIIGHAL